jgi:hypothetical protein
MLNDALIGYCSWLPKCTIGVGYVSIDMVIYNSIGYANRAQSVNPQYNSLYVG